MENSHARDAFARRSPTELVRPPPDGEHAPAEDAVIRDSLAGALIGAFLCVSTWSGIVFLALSGTRRALLEPVATGSGIGVFIGVVLGGWAGNVVGTRARDRSDIAERAEVDRRTMAGSSPERLGGKSASLAAVPSTR